MLRPEVQLISVDDHVVEPPHTFHDHIDPKYRNAAPRVVSRGPGVEGWEAGDRAGITFLGTTCGTCEWCRSGR